MQGSWCHLRAGSQTKANWLIWGLIHETDSEQYTPNKWWQPHESTVEFLLNCHPCVVSQGEGNEGIMDTVFYSTTFYVSNFKEWKRTKLMFAERVAPYSFSSILWWSPWYPVFSNEEIQAERAKVLCQRLCFWSMTKLKWQSLSVS